ncbi:hypothetical protein LES60_05195 [Pectobacterium brasiliense]|uniref:hypothetical protein n=1 Tax=Pectobacterium TaxID=122277 RepID=UPI0001A44D7F|nr:MULTISPECIES: hypothetical protein [Pectobacterium]ARA77046.1 hypothetical protein B5S52_14580 [Pectobacterium brasiliense]KFF61992.1 hypothetical protein IW00_18905 [Pectobacterium brasiliense]KFF63268.1 hypothetical protein IV99_17825 [Pectobacterium brasiliense]KGA22612.1 hypothetical protein KS44_17375 [Pectobacterium brasiliense]KHS67894.1 hypothetical protein RC77_09660 [Pectobacterium brasiliense]
MNTQPRYFQTNVLWKKVAALNTLGRFIIALSMTTISKLIFFIGDYRRLDDCINSLPQECSSYDPRLGFGE